MIALRLLHSRFPSLVIETHWQMKSEPYWRIWRTREIVDFAFVIQSGLHPLAEEEHWSDCV